MMRVLLLAALLLLSGCLQGDGVDHDAVAEEVARTARPVLVQEHDHHRAALHNGSHNLEVVGYHNGFDASGDPAAIPAAGYYTELAVTPGYVYLARHSDDGSYGGFSILDVADPAAPVLVGHFPGLGGSDLEVTDDEAYAFFATQRNTPEQVLGHLVDDGAAGPRGISVVDLGDKTAPALASFFPLPVNGPHTLTHFRHEDGQEYLVVSTYDLLTEPGTGAIVGAVGATQRVLILQFDRDSAALSPVSQWQLTDRPPEGKLYFPHDTSVQIHPSDGRTYLYVAYWDKGLQILDITDPARPEHVSGHTEFQPSSRNNIHQARPFEEEIEGRHVTVTQPEIISADETGHVFFLDTSDPYDPQRLGHWTLPSDLIVQQLEFSPHNFDTWDGKVALAHNHAGLWVIDAGSEGLLQEPREVAFHMPAPPRPDSPRPQPYVWGVFEQDGLLYVSDEATGLHILRYTGP